jgi:dTDP-4-amino-4,6-dideoxygalactose transaminase
MVRWPNEWRCWRATAVSSSISIISRASTAGSTAFQAAILSAKLPHLPAWTMARQDAAKLYDAGLNQIEDVVVPQVGADRSHVYHLYTIRRPRRDALAEARGVQTAINYPTALPFLEAYSRLKARPEQFPNAHRDQGRILSLPMLRKLRKISKPW